MGRGAGNFTSVLGQPRNNIARLNADGTLDTSFNPYANGYIFSVAVQTDGLILLGGNFSSVGGTTRNCVARVDNAGTLDAGFNPNANNSVYSMAVQADGKILLGGTFNTMGVGGAVRNLFARLLNAPATQTLSGVNTTQVLWTRGGSAPEVSQVTVELSTNGGSTANWQLTGLSLPTSGHLRARGRTTNGLNNGGSGLVERVVSFSAMP